MSFRASFFALLAVALAHLPATASACTACMGKPTDSPMADAMNGAIYFMLGCIGFMLAFVSAIGIAIVRRSRQPLPPHAAAALTEPIDPI